MSRILKSCFAVIAIMLLAGFKPGNTHDAINISVTTQSPSSATAANGQMTIILSGGKAPYNVSVMGTTMQAQTFKTATIQLKNLKAGQYFIMVQDSDKNNISKTIELIAL